jgi:hypothetical protein
MQSLLTRRVVVGLTSSVLFCGALTCNAQMQSATAVANAAPTVPPPPVTRSGGNAPSATAESATGSIGRAALQLRDFEHDGIQLELGEIEFNNVKYRTTENGKFTGGKAGQSANQPMQVTGAGLSKVHLIINAASLQKLMQGRIEGVSNLRVSLQNDRVKITGTRPAPFIGVPLPFALDAKLEARQGDQLWLSDARLTLGGAPVPEGVAKSVLGSINPIYVVNFTQQWGFRTAIKTITTRNDKLDITGNLVFMTAATPGVPATGASTAGALKPAGSTDKTKP